MPHENPHPSAPAVFVTVGVSVSVISTVGVLETVGLAVPVGIMEELAVGVAVKATAGIGLGCIPGPANFTRAIVVKGLSG